MLRYAPPIYTVIRIEIIFVIFILFLFLFIFFFLFFITVIRWASGTLASLA